MKKLTLFITTLLLSLVLVFAFGCNDQPIVCKDGEHQAQLTLTLDSEDLNVYNKGVCEICGSEVKQFVGYGAVSSNTASKAINEYASSGDVVYLTTGTYSSVINVYTDNDVTITAFPGQTIKAKGFKIQTQASITIDGINFEVSYDSGGINFAGNNKNVTIKNCNFKGNAYITNETHAHEVKNLLVENLGVAEEKITLESEIIKDLGADSLDLVEMLLSMEENFGITISDDQTENIKTVKDIVDIIENN